MCWYVCMDVENDLRGLHQSLSHLCIYLPNWNSVWLKSEFTNWLDCLSVIPRDPPPLLSLSCITGHMGCVHELRGKIPGYRAVSKPWIQHNLGLLTSKKKTTNRNLLQRLPYKTMWTIEGKRLPVESQNLTTSKPKSNITCVDHPCHLSKCSLPTSLTAVALGIAYPAF